ncbi:MAG: ABC transporter ATP-binding protein [Intrasporangium sp.]|uniref:ABC transporter ATP-binding protein n=1 Tax=Intrasporangium sp. TaxID=1925024 RepID=UPI003F7E8B49
MITFDHVTVRFPESAAPALDDVTLQVPEGELVLVIGPTGSGKSTLLRCVNGLVPHFSGGLLSGSVVVDGLDTRQHRPRDLATVVGLVEQNPVSTFVTDVVEDEIAYGMETMGLDPTTIRRRVEETLDLFGLTPLRTRALESLSGGQQQRVAIAAVFAAGPRILVLDEPTSALDPVAAEEVLASLDRIVHDLGTTVILAEHRLERVIHHADRVVLLDHGRTSALLDPAEAMRTSPIHPPVVALAHLAEWDPPPLSIRDARRRVGELRRRLTGIEPSAPRTTGPDAALALDGLRVLRGGRVVLDAVDLTIERGSVTALMGRNGAGKSTLLGAVGAQLAIARGRVRVGTQRADPHALRARDRVRVVGLVPQQPELLLYTDSVADECASADRDFEVPAGTTAELLDAIAGPIERARHPRDLSEGQRLELALAVILAGGPEVLLLDEPTRGLDYGAKRRLAVVLARLAEAGTTIVLATHDVEMVAECADRVIILADGELVADGPVREVLAASPAFAPQVTKVLHPQPWLTVDDVAAALGRSA